MIRAYLLKHGDDVEAMRLLARIGMAREVFDDAELLLAAVSESPRTTGRARAEYAEMLIELHKYPQAHAELDRLIQADPANRLHYQGLKATASVGLGEHERAVALYRDVLQGTSADADIHLSIAHALKTMGRSDEAIESYRRAAHTRDGFRRRLLEPRQPQDLPVHGRRTRPAARNCKPTPHSRPPTAFICASPSARHSRTGATTPSRSSTTSRATR